jgi:hypothetical protein
LILPNFKLGARGRPKKGENKPGSVSFNFGRSVAYIIARLKRDGEKIRATGDGHPACSPFSPNRIRYGSANFELSVTISLGPAFCNEKSLAMRAVKYSAFILSTSAKSGFSRLIGCGFGRDELIFGKRFQLKMVARLFDELNPSPIDRTCHGVEIRLTRVGRTQVRL